MWYKKPTIKAQQVHLQEIWQRDIIVTRNWEFKLVLIPNEDGSTSAPPDTDARYTHRAT